MSDDAERRRIIRHDKDAYTRYSQRQAQVRPELVKARRRRRIATLAYLVLLAVAATVAICLAR